MSWSAEQYTKFEQERNRPITDLLANIPNAIVNNAVDIGCGPGNSTELLLARYPKATIMGIDSSASMIAAAKKRLPNVLFELADVTTWTPDEQPDILLANAILQWVPNHETLLPALIRKLAPGGALAVQIPDNIGEPAQTLMREIAASGPWADKLRHADVRVPRHDAEWYYDLLRGHTARLDIWRTIYHHTLRGGVAAIVEWFKGSGLRPFLDALNEDEQSAFLANYEDKLSKIYPVYEDGSILLPFPRLFIVANRE
jgi:trans-aconitate 2-methyltransferase